MASLPRFLAITYVQCIEAFQQPVEISSPTIHQPSSLAAHSRLMYDTKMTCRHQSPSRAIAGYPRPTHKHTCHTWMVVRCQRRFHPRVFGGVHFNVSGVVGLNIGLDVAAIINAKITNSWALPTSGR